MKQYDPKTIEPKWQKIWDKSKLYETNDDSKKTKYYALEFFPYPSGATLHVGHVRNYTINDAWTRYQRMLGKNVLHPMGWDAFGLPAENYAIKKGITPRKSTDANIKVFKRQFKQMGFSYDWSREIDSSRPDYYQWTQWLFLHFYKNGLAYRKQAIVNWCPQDQTVLANEQVVGDKNVCERCGTPVIQKEMEQWFFKITDYADRLIDDLDDLDWPQSIKTMQRNWIGRSQGSLVQFEIDGKKEKIEVFTTRADTLFGATYMVLAPEHPLVSKLTSKEQKAAVEKYVKTAEHKTELDRQETAKTKTGVFTGSYAINPANKEKIPIWIADYVLMSYGTGAIMAVPAHDGRDYEFASKFKLAINQVVEPVLVQTTGSATFRKDEPAEDSKGIIAIVKHWSQDKYLGLHWPGPGWGTLLTGGIDEGFTPEETVLKEIHEETGYKNAKIVRDMGVIHSKYYHEPKGRNRFGHAATFYVELQDNAQDKVSKAESTKHKLVWLSKSNLSSFLTATSHQQALALLDNPVYSGDGLLVNSGQFDGLTVEKAKAEITKWLGRAKMAKPHTQYRLRDWLISRQRYWGAPIPIIYCKTHGAVPVPEKDLPVVLPESVEFKPTGQSPLLDIPDFVNTKCPKCGGKAKRETDTMDTFLDSSWYFLRFTDPHNQTQAFNKTKANYWLPVDMYVGGAEHAVMHLLYARFWTKVLYDAKLLSVNEPFKALRNQGLIGGADGRKMGKRYNNSVTPDDIIDSGYGADALRAYELFIAPFDQDVPWDPQGIVGTRRFLDRAWTLVREFLRESSRHGEPADNQAELEVQLATVTNKYIKKITSDFEAFGFNTAVAALMELVNSYYKLKESLPFNVASEDWQASLGMLVKMLAPITPHIAEELWQELGSKESVHQQFWPNWDEKLLVEDIINVIVQVNGKLRANITAPAKLSEAEMIKLAKAETNVKVHLKGQKVIKTVTVPSKLVNFVLA